ncbi:type IX secretion system membrane protein PorP/SprF [Maribacter algarum]|uniref:Type IX secretion system membrane protein PorP/SprF n=1 Tax=Maribacter algarum (ex Zhang et al. 2020) TaxID=2578118 RepID=A0A5S3QM60_9FLAO|nr:type IX secretion system membrane protein PorP/SprF [Maribacter algarum]TMM58984.1 type IX secretion system membrane protein PorP/SprF [Maribacter algarum]
MKLRNLLLLPLIAFMTLTTVSAQEDDPILPYQVAPQNLLKFNRFLINPTFSTVREDNSYINLLHRNQSVSFKDNDQTYFLSYSGRVGDRSGLGLSVYNQKVGPVANIGALANFAYGIKLSDKSNFTFGANLAYYNTGLNRADVDIVDPNDFRINGTQDSNVLSFQPGFNLSYGQIDFGVFAENLFDYNLKTSETLTDFKNKTYSAHLQYTYPFKSDSGIFESARVMPLARVRMNPRSGLVSQEEQDLSLGGSLILDLPKLGWLQGGYDSFYGASAGAGFNINQRLSLGYTMEKGFGTDFNNLGVTHEISLAYSFTPNLTEDRVMLEEGEELVENEELDTESLASNDEVEELKKRLAENEEVLAELMFRQDSLEASREKDLERRFEMVMRMVRNQTNGERPDLEKRAEQLFLTGRDRPTALANNDNNEGGNVTQDNTRSVRTAPQTNVAVRDNSRTESTSPSTRAVAQDNTRANDYNQGVSRGAIKSRKFKNLDGVNDGYYVVANVYKGGKYMNKFIDNLNEQGFSSDYIDNPKNGMKYVYLERYDTWQEASDAYKSNMDGKYSDDLWIMNVDNRYTNETYASNVDKLQQKSAKYNTDELEKNISVRDRVTSTNTAPRNFKLNGVGSGYYIIANVFAKPSNAKKFVKLLNSYGLSASYFINPENNWRYVYLKRHESWNNALISYYSKINDSYDDKMWIMRVHSDAIT